MVVMAVFACVRSGVEGRRMSQWSSGVFDGRKVGVVGSPMCVREVVVQNVASGMLWEVWCCAGVPCRSPPNKTGRVGCSCVSRVASHVRVSWYDCLPCCVLVCGR